MAQTSILTAKLYYFKIAASVALFFLSITHKSLGQNITLLKEIKIKPPTAVSIDNYNHLFTVDKSGNVYKYDSLGNLLYTYSPDRAGTVTSLEAWPTMQIFTFSRDQQIYSFLSRFLTPVPGFPAKVNNQQIGFVRAATIASTNQIWVFDDTDFSLKKVDPSLQKVVISSPLNQVLTNNNYQINYMREYQNLLYMQDALSGILVFDNLGNYKKALPFPGLTNFNFFKKELYFLSKQKLLFFDLYTLQERTINLPTGYQFKYGLVMENKLALFTENLLHIYELQP